MAEVGLDTNRPGAGASDHHDAFVSYARADGGFADQLRRALTAAGKDVWIDVEDLLGGADWKAYITRAIETCRAFIFILSPASVGSKQCMEELTQALALNKLIVPIFHREFDRESLPPALASREWIFLNDADSFEHGIAKLTDALETDLDWRTEHTRLSARAREWTDAGGERSFLLRGAELRRAEVWLSQQRGHREVATPEQGRFIMESRRNATLRQRTFTTITVVVAVGAGVLALWAFLQRNEARVQRHEALVQRNSAESRSLAFQAEGKLDAAPDVAGLLSLEAYRTHPTAEARNAALASIQALGARAGAFRCRGDFSEAASLAFTGTGHTVTCADANGVVDQWDLARLSPRGRPLHTAAPRRGLRREPVQLAISPDGTRVAAAEPKGTIGVWDIAARRRLHIRFRGGIHGVSELAFSPDGKTLAAAAFDKTVRLWRLSPRGASERLLARADALDLTFSRFGSVLAWTDSRGGVEVWDWVKGRRLRRFERKLDVFQIALDGRGRRLASIGDSGVSVFDARSGKVLATLPTRGSPDQIAVSPQGDKVAYLSDNSGQVQLWSLPAHGPIATDLSGPRGLVSALAFNDDGSLIGALDGAGGVYLWHTDRGHLIDTILPVSKPGPYGSTDALAFSPNDRWLASSEERGVDLWDLSEHVPRREHLPGTPLTSQVLAFGGAKRLFVLGDQDVQSWRLTTNGATRERRDQVGPQRAASRHVYDIELSPFGNELAFQSNDGTLTTENLQTRRIRHLHFKRDALTTPSAFRPDGQEIAVAPYSRIMRYSLTTGAALPGNFWHHFTVEAMAYSPDGKTLASAPGDHTIHLWDLTHPRRRSTVLIGHGDDVWEMAFSPDGKMLASASLDRTVRLWDLRSGRALGAPLKGHRGAVFSLAFSRDGKTLASGSEDGTIRLWSSALWSQDPRAWKRRVCDAVRRSLSHAEWRELIPNQPYHETCPER